MEKSIREMGREELQKLESQIVLTPVNNDYAGNPRYVCHYSDIDNSYEIAVKKANKIGGRKFHNKQYGGGIVFQSSNIYDLRRKIKSISSTLN